MLNMIVLAIVEMAALAFTRRAGRLSTRQPRSLPTPSRRGSTAWIVDEARAPELTFIKEMILLQIRTWFEYVRPIPDDDHDAGADADARFAAFLEILAEQLGG